MDDKLKSIMNKIGRLINHVKQARQIKTATAVGLELVDKPGAQFVKWSKEMPELKENIYTIWNDVVRRMGVRANYGGAHVFFINSWNKRFREGVVKTPCKFEIKERGGIEMPAPKETVEDWQTESKKTMNVMKDAVNSSKTTDVEIIKAKIDALENKIAKAFEKTHKKPAKEEITEKEKLEIERKLKQQKIDVVTTKNKIAKLSVVLDKTGKLLHIMKFVPVTSVDYEKQLQELLGRVYDTNKRISAEIDTFSLEFDKLQTKFDSMLSKVATKKEAFDPITLGLAFGALGLGTMTIALIRKMFRDGFLNTISDILGGIKRFVDIFTGRREEEIVELTKMKLLSRITMYTSPGVQESVNFHFDQDLDRVKRDEDAVIPQNQIQFPARKSNV